MLAGVVTASRDGNDRAVVACHQHGISIYQGSYLLPPSVHLGKLMANPRLPGEEATLTTG